MYMKKILKNIFIVLLIAFVGLQFVRSPKNESTAAIPNAITAKYKVPDDIMTAFKASCYDCHSNNTKYPWYSHIQPVSWWLSDHIEDGKRHFNFDEFSAYSIGKQYRKLEEVSGEIEEGEMPLKSYTLIHGDAKLTDIQKASIASWVNTIRDSIKAQYPIDSLERPKKK
jgi:Haem-binding domain